MPVANGRRKVDVVQLVGRFAAGGVPEHVVLLARRLEGAGYSTALVTGRHQEGYEVDGSWMLRPSDRVVWIPELSRSVSLSRDVQAFQRLAAVFKRLRPLIVHTHTAKAGLLGRLAAKLAGVPVIVHSFHGNLLKGYFPRPLSRALQALERSLATITDAICVLCPQQANELSNIYRIAPCEKFRVVPHGIDFPEPSRCTPKRQRKDRFVAGWLGRLVPIKNVNLLCAIVRESGRRGVPVTFVVAGDGPEREKLLALQSEVGAERLSFVGWCREIAGLIQGCDVLIQTSINEGMPLALIQGMAAGKPFVSTPAGGVVDMVAPPVQRQTARAQWFANGVLVSGEAAAFVDVLGELAVNDELVRDMGCRALRFARSRYQADRLLTDICSLYSELLRSKAAEACAAAPSAAEG